MIASPQGLSLLASVVSVLLMLKFSQVVNWHRLVNLFKIFCTCLTDTVDISHNDCYC